MKVEIFKIGAVFLMLFSFVLCLPVQTTKKPETKEGDNPDKVNIQDVINYEYYLKEVVEALESDPDFRKKLDKAPEADIRNGKIAQELDYVSHHVRSKLDEIKRRELDRLRNLAKKQYELSNDIDRVHLKVPEHLDHRNEHTFEIEDLKKLIFQASHDLAEADKQRKKEFKEYELQKEFEKNSILNELDDESKKTYEEELRNQREKGEHHEKVHHPGNKAQLEEVWEKQDHMDGLEFDPKTFFMMHDVDGNGVWDETELKALFIKELDKVYNSGAPEHDIRERAEEMERMREHVFQESDSNHDGLISFEEFIAQTKKADFQADPEWDTVDKVPQFTHEEYLEFERKRQEEIQRLIANGQLPAHPNIPQGYHQREDPQVYQQGHVNQQQQQQQNVHGYPQQNQIPHKVQLNTNEQYVVQNNPQAQKPFPQQQGQQYAQQGNNIPQQSQQLPQQGQIYQQPPQPQPQLNQPLTGKQPGTNTQQHQQQQPQYQQQQQPQYQQQQQPQYQQQQPQYQQQQQPQYQQNMPPQQQGQQAANVQYQQHGSQPQQPSNPQHQQTNNQNINKI